MGSSKKSERIGQIRINNHGSKMTIIDYTNVHNLTVRFDDGYITDTWYKCFDIGGVKNPYNKTVVNIGYLGEGKYKASKNRKHTSAYIAWKAMLNRCYDIKYIKERHTYKDVYVCKEWHNFQNFAEWHEKNYYKVSEERMELDKDILVKGNKIYSPKTCVFAPIFINGLFAVPDKSNKPCPLGVTTDKKNSNYSSSISVFGKQMHLGKYASKKDAYLAYKIEKEKYIKEVAEKYKNQIPNNLYEAMYKYEFKIDD